MVPAAHQGASFLQRSPRQHANQLDDQKKELLERVARDLIEGIRSLPGASDDVVAVYLGLEHQFLRELHEIANRFDFGPWRDDLQRMIANVLEAAQIVSLRGGRLSDRIVTRLARIR
jgi:hypothetical protein